MYSSVSSPLPLAKSLFFPITHCFLPNETQAQPRLRGTQVAASIGTLAKLDMKKQRRLSRWLHRLVRRFHLCSGEKHVDSDRALPTGVCLLSISRPTGE